MLFVLAFMLNVHAKDIFAVVRFTNKADILDRDLTALSDSCSSVIEQSLGRDDEIDVAFGPELQQLMDNGYEVNGDMKLSPTSSSFLS